ncbi:unnamed protein product [Paramecium octaurelia]|uniref:Uncharacterized protein n=1 Tax=Paramecium octaurelia TaxID=43137 RepID=A0A8S1YG75_PAROT|nr:unnamed protein product [Paramecium octaurelia]
MQLKQEQLLQIVKEELLKKSKEKHVEKVVPLLTPDLVQYMIVNDLPIYEDHLKEILYDQSKEHIGTVIQDLEYKKNLKEQQDEMERQIFLKKTQKRKQKLLSLQQNNPELFLQKTQPQQPQTQMMQLQNNFAKLIQNFTQLVAAQVVQEIKQPIRKAKGNGKKKHKRPSTPEFEQSLEQDQNEVKQQSSQGQDWQQTISQQNSKNKTITEKKHYSPSKIVQKNQQIQFQQKPQQHFEQDLEEDFLSNESFPKQNNVQKVPIQNPIQQSYLTNQQQSSYMDPQQSMGYSQSNYDSKLQKFDEQSKQPTIPGSRSIKYDDLQQDYSSGDLESYDDVEPLQDNKSKFQNQSNAQNQFQQSSDDYPDDFIEESNDRFQQNTSNFYKPKYQAPAPEQVDFDDDIEDLLL